MKGTFFDRHGNATEDVNLATGALFEGNDAVETVEIPEEAFVKPEEIDSHYLKLKPWGFMNPVLGENNISIFIDPDEKIFNVISCDTYKKPAIGTSVSFIGEDYDRFMNLMKALLDRKPIQ